MVSSDKAEYAQNTCLLQQAAEGVESVYFELA